MRGCNRRKESRRLLTVLISKRRKVTVTGGEVGGRVVWCLELDGQCSEDDDCSSI